MDPMEEERMGSLCPTSAHGLVVSNGSFVCSICRREQHGGGVRWACGACGEAFCFACHAAVPAAVADGGTAPAKRRWTQRLEAARNVMRIVATNARPVSSCVAAAARSSGEMAGGVIKTGSFITGGVVAGAGLLVFGGAAGAACLMAGAGMATAG